MGRKWIKHKTVLILIVITVTSIGLHVRKNKNFVNVNRPVIPSYMSFDKNQASKDNYLILWYAKPDWISVTDAQNITGCSFDNCIVTSDKEAINQSKVVLFHHAQMGIQPPLKSNNQMWGFMSLESPLHTHGHYRKPEWKGKFDFTFSYRTDSEVYAPYNQLVKRKNDKELNYTSLYLNKTKEVAWIVSNCNTPSKRQEYVQEMQREIKVDIFGKCGKKCQPPSGGDCFEIINREYKFYLSFENSLCEDYITEKVYRLFNDQNLVPVVRGAPNVNNRLPVETFISSLDFKSTKHLTNYLTAVSNSQRLYTNYLRAKHKYKIFDGSQYSPYYIGMCSLCEKLNKGTLFNNIIDVSAWIQNKPCLPPNDIG